MGGAHVTVSDDPPLAEDLGDLWYDSNEPGVPDGQVPVASDPPATSLVGDLWYDTNEASLAGQIIESASWEPVAETEVSTSGGGLTAVDPALAVSFAVPASGSVYVTLNARGVGGSAGSALTWGLLDSSTPVVGTETKVVSGPVDARWSCAIAVNGLTPGDTLTWRWGHNLTAGGSGLTAAGGLSGAALMVVSAA